MSTLWLTSLVGISILIVVGIAYTAHRIELNKIESKRRAGFHREKYRSLSFIIETLPNKALKGELPQLLVRSMVMHLEEAQELGMVNLDLKKNLQSARELYQKVSKGESLPSKAVGGSIGDQLKDVQRGIKLLKEFILQQHRAGLLSKVVATGYIKSLHDVNLTATIDGLVSQATHSKGEGNSSLALRYFQLALNEITKSKSSANYKEQSQSIAGEIKQLKADKKAAEDANQEDNEKLVQSITSPKDDGDSFDMKQIN